MIASFVMNGSRMELPIDSGIEREKMLDRIQVNDKTLDWYGSLYDSLSITADSENGWWILVSDYSEQNQVNDGTRSDFIELLPGWELLLPWNKQVQAFNRPFVMWQEGDVIKVVAR